MNRPKISVCVPVYNVANYIEQCARSLFEQTIDDIEYLFVDDCTPDNSIEILKKVLNDYPDRFLQTKIIHNKENQGQSGVFKTLLTNAAGEYIITCDSDDWAELDMYEKLYQKAKESDADIVCCDHFKEKASKQIYGISHFEGSYDERMKAWIRREYAAYSWATLVHSRIYSKTHFVQCGFAEDAVRACQFLYYASTYEYLAEPLYHYRCEGQGVTSISKIDFVIRMNVDAYSYIFDFLHKNSGNKYEQDMLVAKLQIKWEWCINRLHPAFYKYWPEVNHFSSLKYLPVSMGRKILLWLAFLRCKWGFNILTKTYRFLQNN